MSLTKLVLFSEFSLIRHLSKQKVYSRLTFGIQLYLIDLHTIYLYQKPDRPFWEGIWDAKAYKPACPQNLWYVRETVPNMGSANISEDCLYMNIFAPNVSIIHYYDKEVFLNPIVKICISFRCLNKGTIYVLYYHEIELLFLLCKVFIETIN